MKTLVVGSVTQMFRIMVFFWTVWKEIKAEKSYRDNTYFILKIHLNELFFLLKGTTS